MLTFFFAMWIVGWANSTAGDPFTANTSFSYMLERVLGMKPVFAVWLPLYMIVVLIIVGLVVDYRTMVHEQYLPESSCTSHTLSFIVILYTIFSLTKLCALVCVGVYDLSTSETEHAVSAALAFGSAILACWCLFARRIIIVLYHHPIEAEVARQSTFLTEHEKTSIEKFHRSAQWFLVFNLIWNLLGLSFLLAFVFTYIGVMEFFLTLYVVSDPFLQIWDFESDPRSIERRHYTSLLVRRLYF